MARKTDPARLDNSISEYFSCGSARDACEKHGVSLTVFYRELRKRGIKTIPVVSETINIGAAKELFDAGFGVTNVASKIGVSPGALLRAFSMAGIQPRNRSEQMKVRMASMSPEGRRHLASHAFEKLRGVPVSEEKLINRAIGLARSKSRTSHYEVALANMLRERGIAFDTQTAIGPYNCDISIGNVAVEVWGGKWHWYGRHIMMAEKRFRYIMNAGYDILVIAVDASRPLTPAVTDYLVAEIDIFRSNPSSARQYRVVWGAGEFSTGGTADDDEFSVKPPFTSARNPRTGQYESVPR